jgi:hypothetical protein
MLALIAGTVSHLHMHVLVEIHCQPRWVAALTPLMLLSRGERRFGPQAARVVTGGD